MGTTVGDVLQTLKVAHNACHQKKEPHTQRLYMFHQRPNPEYWWHNHLPRSRAIIRPHLEQTSGKGGSKSQQVCFIRKPVATSSSEVKTVAYKTLVGPQMEYRACIKDSHTQLLINKQEWVQRCATCWITEYHRMTSVTEMMAKLGWEPVDCSFYHKLFLWPKPKRMLSSFPYFISLVSVYVNISKLK